MVCVGYPEHGGLPEPERGKERDRGVERAMAVYSALNLSQDSDQWLPDVPT